MMQKQTIHVYHRHHNRLLYLWENMAKIELQPSEPEWRNYDDTKTSQNTVQC